MAVSVAAALLAPGQIRAATVNIDFTFTNPSVGDVVTGEIDGLTVGGTSSASAVYITGYTDPPPPSPYSSIYTFPTPLLMTAITTNSFTVDGSGDLTVADFNGEGFFGSPGTNVNLAIVRVLPSVDVGGVFQNIYPASGPIVQSGGDFGQLDYVPVPVSATPLPAALPLFATGLGALGLFGWRKKRKNAAANAAP